MKIRKADRDENFSKKWEKIYLLLDGESDYKPINVRKSSFWEECSELISREIGNWFIKHELEEWKYRHPHKFKLQQVADNKFVLKLPPLGLT